jgi:spore germination protein (amino acid permease)
MAEGKKYGFTDFQWVSVAVSAILGAGMLTLPRSVGEIAGRDGWISIILAGIVAWIFALFIWLLCRKFPTKTLAEFSITILGRPLGILVSVLYSFYSLMVCGVVLRVLSDMLRTWVFLWTPTPVFVVLTLLAIGYVSRMGAITLGRLMEVKTLLSVTIVLMFLIPIPEFVSLNLRPVGAEGLKILQAVPKAAFAYLGLEVMLVLFPFIINKNKVLKLNSIALGIVTGAYAADAILVFGVLGIEYTLNLVWPLMIYMRIGSLPFLQRVDNLLLFGWTTLIISVAAVHYFSATYTLATLTRRQYHDIWSLVCLPLVYVVSRFPTSIVAVFDLSKLIGIVGYSFCLGITALMLIVAKIRGLDEREGKA